VVGEPADIVIETFDWDSQLIEHIARHDVGPADVESALRNQARFFLNLPGRSATHVMVGRDRWDRVLYVPILCIDWPDRWRVISAWESRFARGLLANAGEERG